MALGFTPQSASKFSKGIWSWRKRQ